MSLVTFNPGREVMTMHDAVNRLLEETRNMLDRTTETRIARVPMDVYSTENEIVVTASLPGVSPEDVEITVEGDSLSIRGEVPAYVEGVRYIFAERFHGHFVRTLQLNVPIDVDNIKATFENGVLTLVLPKAEEIRPRVIKVNAK